jgi:hypothetical protein
MLIHIEFTDDTLSEKVHTTNPDNAKDKNPELKFDNANHPAQLVCIIAKNPEITF